MVREHQFQAFGMNLARCKLFNWDICTCAVRMMFHKFRKYSRLICSHCFQFEFFKLSKTIEILHSVFNGILFIAATGTLEIHYVIVGVFILQNVHWDKCLLIFSSNLHSAVVTVSKPLSIDVSCWNYISVWVQILSLSSKYC